MHVEIHHRHALPTMSGPGMRSADRYIVEEAKTHGAITFGMMSRWPNGAKSIVNLAGRHGIDPRNDCPGRPQGRVPRAWRDNRITIQHGQARLGDCRKDTCNIIGIVYALDGGTIRQRRFDMAEPGKSRRLQCLQDDTQAIDSFRMSATGIMS
jgi:hypothetical protein